MRAAICQGLAWAGIAVDDGRNAAGETRISAAGSDVPVFVIPANEELPIARSVRDLT